MLGKTALNQKITKSLIVSPSKTSKGLFLDYKI